jgi:hypothetical protein
MAGVLCKCLQTLKRFLGRSEQFGRHAIMLCNVICTSSTRRMTENCNASTLVQFGTVLVAAVSPASLSAFAASVPAVLDGYVAACMLGRKHISLCVSPAYDCFADSGFNFTASLEPAISSIPRVCQLHRVALYGTTNPLRAMLAKAAKRQRRNRLKW